MANQIQELTLEEVMGDRFGRYSKYIIQERALPDVRDGLKPVQRRILFAMNQDGNTYDKGFRKSAKSVGNVMGNYHPHGDSSIYEAMVRLSQDWKLRAPLIQMHGNNGSMDGDPPAAMRYTEARLSKISKEMLADIDKETVDMVLNFDDTAQEPTVLPAGFPNLLVNGATGISAGYATEIPPHNLREVFNAILYLLKHPQADLADLMQYVKGPDFPTGGIIQGLDGIKQAYETGRGKIVVRSRTHIETIRGGREKIVVTEIPYDVNKAQMIKKIDELRLNKKVDGIAEVRDETDREGMRIVIDVRRDASAEVILNNLYKMTLMQTTYNFNMLAIVKGAPKILSLKEILQYYLEHQEEVVRRRTEFDLKKAQNRAHIVAGLRIALDHIDAIINIIRSSETSELAKQRLMDDYSLSDRQAQAILDLRLVRLTGLEREKIEDEYQKLVAAIADYKDILAHQERINQIIYDELMEIQNKFGDERRTELQVGDISNIEDEDLIEEEDIIVTLTHNGYVKRLPVDEFKAQNRGGRGVKGMGVHSDDFIEHLVASSTHDLLLFFTNTGKVFAMKGYEIPEYGRAAQGIPIINLLDVDGKEKVTAVINVAQREDDLQKDLFFVTRQGTVKRTPVTEFKNIRSNGLKAINLHEGDELINVAIVDDDQNMILGTHLGYAATFKVSAVRSMGRSAAGVRGARLRDGDYLIGAAPLNEDDQVLVISEKGYGKKTPVSEYPIKGRGGLGIKTVNVTEKNGPLAGLTTVQGDEDLMVVTDKGVIIRFGVESVSQTGRSAIGVHLIKMDADSVVATMTKVEKETAEMDPTEASAEEAETPVEGPDEI